MDWVRHAIFWHLYPLGFVGAETTASLDAAAHRLGHLHAWLDYAVQLGASGILLGPIFASSTHGYDTVDHFRIDPRLGDDADFDALVTAAHGRGLRIILDGVFNHVGRDFPAFQTVLAKGPSAGEASWFRLEWRCDHIAGAEPAYETFEGHHQLVALNHCEPAVADYIIRVMNHWLERGVSGWRLDAAYAVSPGFWARVLPEVRAKHPDAYIFGEVIHGDCRSFVRDSGVDAVTQYELWKAIWSALNDRNLFELAWALDRHNRFLDDFVPLTFLGNHDVTRLASRLNDERHIAHALAVLLTVGGTPCIYAGDEQAFQGVKEDRRGGDDAIRPMFPSNPDGLAPYGWSVFRLHQSLIGLRRRHAWLHRAQTRVLHLTNKQMTFEAYGEGNSLIVALNLDEAEVTQPMMARTIVAGNGRLIDSVPGKPCLTLPGHGWAILSGKAAQPGRRPAMTAMPHRNSTF
jgi:cyclomaltodextrinase